MRSLRTQWWVAAAFTLCGVGWLLLALLTSDQRPFNAVMGILFAVLGLAMFTTLRAASRKS